MDDFFFNSSNKNTRCPRCGNPNHKADPLSPFPFCDECIICDECGGNKFIDGKLCGKCRGNGFVLIKLSEYESSSDIEYDEETDDFFGSMELDDEEVEMVSLEDLAEEEFAEMDFEEEDEDY